MPTKEPSSTELRHLQRTLTKIERSILAMSANLDALTAAVVSLEASSAAAVTEIGNLTSGSDTAALPAITDRINAVRTNLEAAVTPPVKA